MTTKPRLIISDEPRHIGLEATTYEQRQGYRDRSGARIAERAGIGMTAAELIALMGPLWSGHPDFKARPRAILPMPNIANLQLPLSGYKCTMWDYVKRAFWVAT